MGCFLPSEVARLVLGYLKEEGCKKSEAYFLRESHHLKEYASLLSLGREYSLCVMGKTLGQILDDYGKIKMEDEKMYSTGLTKLWVKITSDGRVLCAPLPTATPHIQPIAPNTTPLDHTQTGCTALKSSGKDKSKSKTLSSAALQAGRTRRSLRALQKHSQATPSVSKDSDPAEPSVSTPQSTPACSGPRTRSASSADGSPARVAPPCPSQEASPDHCIHRTTAMLTGATTPGTYTCTTSPHPSINHAIISPRSTVSRNSPRRNLQTSLEEAGDHADCSAMDTGFDTSGEPPPSCHSTPVKSPRRLPNSPAAACSPSFSGAISRSCHNSPAARSLRRPHVADSCSTPASPASMSAGQTAEEQAPPLHIPTEPQLPQTPVKQPLDTNSMPALLYTPAKSIADSERASICGKSPRRKGPAPKRRSIGDVAAPRTGSNENTCSSEMRGASEEAITEKMLEELLNNKAWAEKLAERINKVNEVKGIVRDSESPQGQEVKEVAGPAAVKDTPATAGSEPAATPAVAPVWEDMNTQTGELLGGDRDRDMDRNALQDIVDMTCNDPDFDMLFNMFKVDKFSFVEKEYGVQPSGANDNQMSLSDATASALETLYNDAVPPQPASLPVPSGLSSTACSTTTVASSSRAGLTSEVPSGQVTTDSPFSTSLVPSCGVATATVPHTGPQCEGPSSASSVPGGLAKDRDLPQESVKGRQTQKVQVLHPSRQAGQAGFLETVEAVQVVVAGPSTKQSADNSNNNTSPSGPTTLLIEANNSPVKIRLPSNSPVRIQLSSRNGRPSNMRIVPGGRRGSEQLSDPESMTNSEGSENVLQCGHVRRSRVVRKKETVRSKAAQSAAGEPCSDSESVCSSEGSGQSHSSRGIGRTHGAKDSKYISRSYVKRSNTPPSPKKILKSPSNHPLHPHFQDGYQKSQAKETKTRHAAVKGGSKSGVLTVPVGTKPITVKLPNSSAALNQLVAQLGPGVKVIMPGKQANPDLRGEVSARRSSTAAEADRPLDKVADRPPDKVADRPPDKVADRPPDKVADRPPDKVADRPPDKVADRPPDKVADRPPDKVADRPPDKVADRPPNKLATDKPASPPPSNHPPDEASPQASTSVSLSVPSLSPAQGSPLSEVGSGTRKAKAKPRRGITPTRGRGGVRTRGGGRRGGKVRTSLPQKVIDLSDIAGMESLIETSRPAAAPVATDREDVIELPVTVELDTSLDMATPSPRKPAHQRLSMPHMTGGSPIRALDFKSPRKDPPHSDSHEPETVEAAETLAAIAAIDSAHTKSRKKVRTGRRSSTKASDDAVDMVTASQVSSQPTEVCSQESTVLVCSQASQGFSQPCSQETALNESTVLMASQAGPQSQAAPATTQDSSTKTGQSCQSASQPQPSNPCPPSPATRPQSPAPQDVSEYFPMSPSPGPDSVDGGSAAEESCSADRSVVSRRRGLMSPRSVPPVETEPAALSPCSASMPAPAVEQEPQAPDPAGAAAAPRQSKPRRIFSFTPVVPRQGHAPSAHSTPIPREPTAANVEAKTADCQSQSAPPPCSLKTCPSAPVSRVPSPTMDKQFMAPSPAMSDTQVAVHTRQPRRIRPIEVPADSNDAPWPPKKAVVRSEGPDTFPLCSPSQDSMSCGSSTVSPTMATGTKPSVTIAGSTKSTRSKGRTKETKKKSKKSHKKGSPLKKTPKGKKSKKSSDKDKSDKVVGKGGKRSRCNSTEPLEFVDLEIGGYKQKVQLEAMAKAVASLAGTNQGREFLEHLHTKHSPGSPSATKAGSGQKKPKKTKQKQSNPSENKESSKVSEETAVSEAADNSHLLSMPNIMDIAVDEEDAENIKQFMETGLLPEGFSPQKKPPPQEKVAPQVKAAPQVKSAASQSPPKKKPRRGGQRKKGMKDLSIPNKCKAGADAVEGGSAETAAALQTTDVGQPPCELLPVASTAEQPDMGDDGPGSNSNSLDKSHVRTLDFGSPENTSNSKGFFPVMAKLHSGSASASPQGYDVISKPATDTSEPTPSVPDPADIDSLLGLPGVRRHQNTPADRIRTFDLHSTSSNLLFSDSMSRFSVSNLMSDSMQCELLQALKSPVSQKAKLDTPLFKVPTGISPRKPPAAQISLKRNLSELGAEQDKPLDLRSPSKSGSGVSHVSRESRNNDTGTGSVDKQLVSNTVISEVQNPLSQLADLNRKISSSGDFHTSQNYSELQSSKGATPAAPAGHSTPSEVGAGGDNAAIKEPQGGGLLKSNRPVPHSKITSSNSSDTSTTGKNRRRSKGDKSKETSSNDRKSKVKSRSEKTKKERTKKETAKSDGKSDVGQRKNNNSSNEFKKKPRATKSAKAGIKPYRYPKAGSPVSPAAGSVSVSAGECGEQSSLSQASSMATTAGASGTRSGAGFLSEPDISKTSFHADTRNIQDILREASSTEKPLMSSTLDLSRKPTSGPKNAYLFSPERLRCPQPQPSTASFSEEVISPQHTENSNSSPDVFSPDHGPAPGLDLAHCSATPAHSDTYRTPTWLDESSMPSPFLKRNITPKFSQSPTTTRVQSQSNVSPARSPLLNRLIKQTSECMSRSPSVSSSAEDTLPDLPSAAESTAATVLRPDNTSINSTQPTDTISTAKKRKRSGENDEDAADSRRQRLKLKKPNKKAKIDSKFQKLDLDKFLKKVHSDQEK